MAMDMVEGLHYKLWMMGVLLKGLVNLFCNNISEVTNFPTTMSTLKKKPNVIAYHGT
jgi:hypothetical protein